MYLSINEVHPKMVIKHHLGMLENSLPYFLTSLHNNSFN